MSDNNLYLWEKHEKTDEKFTKRVDFGGFKYDSVNPQWQKWMATKEWGPCGKGWGYDYEMKHNDFPDGTRLCECHLTLWYTEDGSNERFYTRHIGVAEYSTITKAGSVRKDVEGPKKALTNAVSKTLSNLGFSSDLYLGYFESPDYKNVVAQEFESERQSQKFENMLSRLKTMFEQTGAEAGSGDEEILCRFWSDGKYGVEESFTEEDAVKSVLRGQSNVTAGKQDREKIPVAKQLEAARKAYKS